MFNQGATNQNQQQSVPIGLMFNQQQGISNHQSGFQLRFAGPLGRGGGQFRGGNGEPLATRPQHFQRGMPNHKRRRRGMQPWIFLSLPARFVLPTTFVWIFSGTHHVLRSLNYPNMCYILECVSILCFTCISSGIQWMYFMGLSSQALLVLLLFNGVVLMNFRFSWWFYLTWNDLWSSLTPEPFSKKVHSGF